MDNPNSQQGRSHRKDLKEMNHSTGTDKPSISGEFVQLDGETFYRISAYDRMPPFLMSIANDTDLWMFLSSAGGLTAGRVDAEGCLFPYETVDKLHDGHHHTGPLSLFRVRTGPEPETVWQPFSDRCEDHADIERNLYKNVPGNRVVFEEINNDLELVFRYRWTGCDEFGIVRTVSLHNRGPSALSVSMVDGMRNVLPAGVPLALYQQLSCLVDAYKRCDCDPDTGLGIFSLTSRIIDRPEAAEVLRANIVWCAGLEDSIVCLSGDTPDAFRRGDALSGETLLTGRRGNYFIHASRELAPGATMRWHIAADAARSHAQIGTIRTRLRQDDLGEEIEHNLQAATESLSRLISSADGLQLTARTETHVHHTANVLYNSMRGGIFSNNYEVPSEDFRDFLRTRNRAARQQHAAFLDSLPAGLSLPELIAAADSTGDTNLRRLSREYLPIFFGRRHGDPSRPWNHFSIEIKKSDGGRALRYEGNWRDIFQNWEALSLSFPAALQNMISKFVNASTVDGFNPYRITRDGIDWEIVDPDDPWSFIGYWGDHQIIYLLKFLEAQERYYPGTLGAMLPEQIFSYADVPYRIAPYDQILEHPHATIQFDAEHASRVDKRVKQIGADGKLLTAPNGSVYHVSLIEKLLVPVLSKLSNFVAGGGIWMNTQRPEWNDANNALAGYGISMVTLCYLRRYLTFLETLVKDRNEAAFTVSSEVVVWFREIASALSEALPSLSEPIRDSGRKLLLDRLGGAFSRYREIVYATGFSGMEPLAASEITGLCRTARRFLDHSIQSNRRKDGLYHAYNLLELSTDNREAGVRHLYEMLEGQVAVISSGVPDTAETVQLLTTMFGSTLYRDDQRSFMLYPARKLPPFLEKNLIPRDCADAIPLLTRLLERKNFSIIEPDSGSVCRFNPDLSNRNDLAAALDRLAGADSWKALVATDRQAVLDLFEETFHHKSYTGRSGTMYGYEGLGSIYWHMVAKLLLAVQETALRTARDPQDARGFKQLAALYYRIRAGLGFEKSAREYGAFPADPYSHTPAHAGAQQPGMTGQVKEEIITRFGELGVMIEDGTVSFIPHLLKRNEFMEGPCRFHFYDRAGSERPIDLPGRALAFTFCQVPVIYELCTEEPWIKITGPDGASERLPGSRLDAERSRALFERREEIVRIDVGIPEQLLLPD